MMHLQYQIVLHIYQTDRAGFARLPTGLQREFCKLYTQGETK